MDKQLLRRRGFTAVGPRKAALKGMRLVIGKQAYLTPNEKETVFGVVVDMTRDEVDRLYAHPEVAEFEQGSVHVRLEDGSAVKALCYNLATDSDVESAPPGYAAELLQLATSLGLPKIYLEKLRQMTDTPDA